MYAGLNYTLHVKSICRCMPFKKHFKQHLKKLTIHQPNTSMLFLNDHLNKSEFFIVITNIRVKKVTEFGQIQEFNCDFYVFWLGHDI